MYSSYISAPLVCQSIAFDNFIVCEGFGPIRSYAYNTMELHPVDYWYEYNVDGFGKAYYNEWDLFWFEETLRGWSV